MRSFSVEQLPYIYQSEYYSLAWGKQHRGFYVLPNGDKYVYNNPESFNFYRNEGNEFGDIAWGDETDLTIAPELLFENLEKCTNKNDWLAFLKSKTLLGEDVLNDLLKSDVINHGQQICDGGILSTSLLIYDAEFNIYKRILLSADGDRKARNQSVYAGSLIRRSGKTKLT